MRQKIGERLENLLGPVDLDQHVLGQGPSVVPEDWVNLGFLTRVNENMGCPFFGTSLRSAMKNIMHSFQNPRVLAKFKDFFR